MSKKDIAGLGALGLFLAPGVAIILLILAAIVIAVMLGLFAVVYLTLQAYHLMTAVIFLVATLLMFYVAIKSGVITKKTVEKHSWMWLVIPGMFFAGYIMENAKYVHLTVAPLSVASPAQNVTNFLMLFVLVACALYILAELSGLNK